MVHNKTAKTKDADMTGLWSDPIRSPYGEAHSWQAPSSQLPISSFFFFVPLEFQESVAVRRKILMLKKW